MTICPSCNYPHPELECLNPRCYENPAVSDATKDKWREEAIQAQREQANRDMLNRALEMSYGYRSNPA